MEKRMHDMAGLFVANGYGFGEYWAGYIFARTTKDEYFFYLSENRMAVLSSGIDEDGEKKIVAAADTFSNEELSAWFRLNYGKTSLIDWFQTVNVLLVCEETPHIRNNLIYYTWPAVKLNFVRAISANTLVVYDRFTPQEMLERLKNEAATKSLASQVEFWSIVKLLAMGDRFGELAPKVCMESIPDAKYSGK
jgi:hypothetical protein